MSIDNVVESDTRATQPTWPERLWRRTRGNMAQLTVANVVNYPLLAATAWDPDSSFTQRIFANIVVLGGVGSAYTFLRDKVRENGSLSKNKEYACMFGYGLSFNALTFMMRSVEHPMHVLTTTIVQNALGIAMSPWIGKIVDYQTHYADKTFTQAARARHVPGAIKNNPPEVVYAASVIAMLGLHEIHKYVYPFAQQAVHHVPILEKALSYF